MVGRVSRLRWGPVVSRNERVGVCHEMVWIIFFSGGWGSSRRLQVPYVIPRPILPCAHCTSTSEHSLRLFREHREHGGSGSRQVEAGNEWLKFKDPSHPGINERLNKGEVPYLKISWVVTRLPEEDGGVAPETKGGVAEQLGRGHMRKRGEPTSSTFCPGPVLRLRH